VSEGLNELQRNGSVGIQWKQIVLPLLPGTTETVLVACSVWSWAACPEKDDSR